MKTSKIATAILFTFSSFAFAQSSSSPPNFKYHDLANGQRVIVPYSSPLPSAAQQAGQQLWNQAMSNTSSGNVQVSNSTSVPNGAGGNVPVNARGRLPAPAVAAAFGRALGATVKAVGPIGIGLAVYDLAKELGFTLNRKSDGSVGITKDAVAGSGDSYQHGYLAPQPTRQLACDALVQYHLSINPGWTFVSAILYGTSCQGTIREPAPGQNTSTTPSEVAVFTPGTAPGAGTASDVRALTDAVAAKSGWPAASKINDVVLADPQQDLQVPVEIVVSGPASSPGPTSRTVNTTNNTTTNNSTTNNYSYAGDTITTSVTNVSVTTNNSTGAITNSETTTSTPPAAKSESITPCGLPGSPACKIDETGTTKGDGAFDKTKTEIDTAKASIDSAIGGAASIPAPAWSFSFQLPTGCAPYVTGIKGVVLNVCQYQSTIHGLLSLIWAAAAAFAMIGMVGRTIRES